MPFLLKYEATTKTNLDKIIKYMQSKKMNGKKLMKKGKKQFGNELKKNPYNIPHGPSTAIFREFKKSIWRIYIQVRSE